MNALDGYFSLVVLVAAKASVLLVAAFALSFAARKSSASARHALWAITFAFLLAIPGMAYVFRTQEEMTISIPVLPPASSDGGPERDNVLRRNRDPGTFPTGPTGPTGDVGSHFRRQSDRMASRGRLVVGGGNGASFRAARNRPPLVAARPRRLGAGSRVWLDGAARGSSRSAGRAERRRPEAKRPRAPSAHHGSLSTRDPSALRLRKLCAVTTVGGNPSRARARSQARLREPDHKSAHRRCLLVESSGLGGRAPDATSQRARERRSGVARGREALGVCARSPGHGPRSEA